MIFSTPPAPMTHRHAHVEILVAVFAREVRGAGQEALLIEEEGLGHGDGARGRGVVGAGAHEADDLAAAPRVRSMIASRRPWISSARRRR
jgi:hypothetical protein